ncbi:MAG: DUF4410 domain-containing protein, partial [Gammaproteobacteria bacterium]
MYKFKLFLTVAALVLIVGCASEVLQTGNIPTVASVKPGDVIYGSIMADPAVASSSDYASSMDDLKLALNDRLHQALPGRQLIFNKLPASANTGLKMEITVLDFNHVSGAGRFFAGIAAGHARLEVRVVLTEIQTGNKVGDAEFGTKSNNWEGIFGGTT